MHGPWKGEWPTIANNYHKTQLKKGMNESWNQHCQKNNWLKLSHSDLMNGSWN